MHDEDNYIYVGVNKIIYLTVKENKIDIVQQCLEI